MSDEKKRLVAVIIIISLLWLCTIVFCLVVVRLSRQRSKRITELEQRVDGYQQQLAAQVERYVDLESAIRADSGRAGEILGRDATTIGEIREALYQLKVIFVDLDSRVAGSGDTSGNPNR